MSGFGLFSCGLHDILPLNDYGITDKKMVEALQEALVLGSRTAALNLGDSSCESNLAELGNCTKGYLGNKLVEIILPDTVSRVLNQINSFTNKLDALPSPVKSTLQSAVGSLDFSGYANSLKNALNRGAEQAAPASVDVFKNAIFGMSFVDAKNVLLGDSVAATSYLHTTTYSGLQNAFGPIIKKPLDLLNPNQHWKPIADAYNSFATLYTNTINSYNSINPYNKIDLSDSKYRLPYSSLDTDLSESLANWATGKALDGLFLMVGKQETKLRADPWGTVKALGGFITDTVGDLLTDVFGSAKDGLI
jgi:hypothetical protein